MNIGCFQIFKKKKKLFFFLTQRHIQLTSYYSSPIAKDITKLSHTHQWVSKLDFHEGTLVLWVM